MYDGSGDVTNTMAGVGGGQICCMPALPAPRRQLLCGAAEIIVADPLHRGGASSATHEVDEVASGCAAFVAMV